eukprot:9114680-Pyramimonas_sp.AAC.1
MSTQQRQDQRVSCVVRWPFQQWVQTARPERTVPRQGLHEALRRPEDGPGWPPRPFQDGPR